jgi:ion channel-forming bestrophin family protein
MLFLFEPVFRTNTSYQRWDEARKNWGMNINHTRDLVRMANAYYDRSATSPERRKKDLEVVSKCTWAFVRAMKRHLSPEKEDEEFFRQELRERLPPQQAEAIIKAAHRPNRALFDLSLAIENLPMHFIRKNEIHRAATIFEDNLGSSERLLTSPVPLFYSRHTARFLSVWLLLLPFAMYDPIGQNTWNSIGLIPATLLISVFLFGIEELATQMEEPFTVRILLLMKEVADERRGRLSFLLLPFPLSCCFRFSPCKPFATRLATGVTRLFRGRLVTMKCLWRNHIQKPCLVSAL